MIYAKEFAFNHLGIRFLVARILLRSIAADKKYYLNIVWDLIIIR